MAKIISNLVITVNKLISAVPFDDTIIAKYNKVVKHQMNPQCMER